MKTQSAKAKGRKLQKEIRDLILAAYPHLSDGDVRSTSMGSQGEDVQLSPLARKAFPFAVECKNLAKIAVYKYYEQAAANAKESEPLVVIKQNRSRPLVILDAEFFIKNWGPHED